MELSDIFLILIVVWSITTHEVAHAWVADRLGDPTARSLGRITLNPIPHIDPFMTVLLPAFLALSGSPVIFGGAKPVPVNITRLGNMRRDWALVGAAGPASNLLIALGLLGLLSVFLHSGVWGIESFGVEVVYRGALINVFLAVFNMVPLPPLDGSRVVQYFLHGEALRLYRKLELYGLLILFGLLFMARGFFMWLLEAFVFPILDGMSHLVGLSAYFA